MGTGSGVGLGTGKGVKGCWRVNVFLLLLTGWQAVLLPWLPLILKDAGFSSTSVGMLSGGTTLAASLGVVACLRGMRRSRSGAVRRLLMWLLLAAATLLQGCAVVLLLQQLSQGGALQSCVSGWPFTPATSVFPLNMSAPTTPRPQRPHTLAPQDTSTTTITPTTKATTSTTVTPTLIPSVPTSTTTTTNTTTTTTPSATIPDSVPITTTSVPSQITVPAEQTFTHEQHDKVLVNNSASTVQTLSPGHPEGGEEGRPDIAGGEISEIKEDTVEAAHKPPVDQRKHHAAAHRPQGGLLAASFHKDVDKSGVSANNSEQDSGFEKPKYHKKNKHRIRPTYDDNDKITLQDDDLEVNADGDSSQDVDEYDNRNEDEDEDDEVDYEDTPQKHLNDYPGVGGRSSGKVSLSSEDALPGMDTIVKFSGVPSSHLQHDVRAGDAAVSRRIKAEIENSFQDFRNTSLFLSKERKQNKESASLLNDQRNSAYRSSRNMRPDHRLLPLVTKERLPHHPPWSFHHSSAITLKDPSNVHWQYDDQDDQVRTGHGRSRRDIIHTDSRDNDSSTTLGTNETVPQLDGRLEIKGNPLETLENESVKAGVAVLLVLGSLVGAGVEAGVAQLWHCYTHGYDEGGVSQDVLQRTITHTFHLSAYGSHKSWTGISSGGWAMVAGVVSILTCLAGAGGSGYGGLLGVHLTLGLGALFVLLLLPVPYGSVDPPRTRRPLSLYLDDEVLREGVRRLTFHLWVFVNGCLTALSLTFSLWLIQEMTVEGWVVGSQAVAVGVTLMCESLALHSQRRLVARCGLHGLMGVCGVSLMLHYGIMWASESVGVVVAAHAGLGVSMAFLWVAVKHNALLLATVSDQEREAWASWWCWRFGVCVGAAVWSVGVSEAGNRVRPLLLLATLIAAIPASFLCVAAVLFRSHSRARRRVYHTLDLDIANEDDEVEEDDAAEDDWLVRRAKKEGLTL